jgi:hypothetical protein
MPSFPEATRFRHFQGGVVSLGVGDFNLDGKPDIATDRGVLLGLGDGTFLFGGCIELPNEFDSFVVADINSDSKPDIIAVDVKSSVRVHIGKGNGSFEEGRIFPAGETPRSLAVGDFNGDMKLDVVIANVNFDTVSVLMGDGNGGLGPRVSYAAGSQPHTVVVRDFNRDGHLDIAVTNATTGNNSGNPGTNGDTVAILLGTGTGTFGPFTRYPAGFRPANLVATDFNGDGVADLATVNLDTANHSGQSKDISVVIANGDGTFQSPRNYTVGDRPLGLMPADFNSDGKPDLAVTNIEFNEIRLLIGNGDGSFTFRSQSVVAGYRAASSVAGDFNLDGKLDIVSRNGGSNIPPGDISVLLGKGDGSFHNSVVNYAAGSELNLVAAIDIDSDGELDLINQEPGLNGNQSAVLLKGNGDGTFQDPVRHSLGFNNFLFRVTDINSDGKADLIAGMGVSLGNGDGTFQSPLIFNRSTFIPNGLTVADVNVDLKLDLILTLQNGSREVYLGNGDGTFSFADGFIIPNLPSDPLPTGDFNGDSLLDLINGEIFNIAIQTRNVDGSFAAPIAFSTNKNPRSIKVADFNHDGQTDVAASCKFIASGGINILLGRCGKTTPTITINSSSNVSVAGSAVTLTATVTSAGVPITTGALIFREFCSLRRGPIRLDENGQATFTTNTFAAGTHEIAVEFSGNENLTSHTETFLQTVMAPPPPSPSPTPTPGCSTPPVPDVANLPDVLADCSVTLQPPTGTDGCGQRVTAQLAGPWIYTANAPFSPLYRNVSGTLIATDNKVSITLNNALTNTQVTHVNQNPSALYFDVSGYAGNATLTSSSAAQTTNVQPDGLAIPAGGVSPNQWVVVNNVTLGGGSLGVCVICPDGAFSGAAPEFTILGGTGSGSYPNANGSIVGNVPHNPFLIGPASYSLSVPGVSANSSFSNISVQFGAIADLINPTPNSLTLTTPGVYTVMWQYPDGHGKTTIQTQRVIIRDTTPPVPDVPSLPTVTGECAATVLTRPTATDGCTGQVISATTSDPLTYNAQGTYLIRWTYTDASGNSSTQTQTVIVKDTLAPVPNVASLPIIAGECSANVTAPTATDNCIGPVTATTTDPTTYTEQGSYIVHWKYSDGRGNIATQDQTVIVRDNTAPTITAPANLVIHTDAAATSCAVMIPDSILGVANATDNCGLVTIARTGVPNGNLFPVGTTTLTYTASDGIGNASTATQTITVIDSTPPTIGNLSDITVVSDAGACSALVNFQLTATDNCAIASLTANHPSGSAFPIGTTSVQATATDAAGNSSSRSFNVTVTNANPVVSIQTPSSGAIFAVNDPVTFVGTYTDAGGGTHSAEWKFGSIVEPGTVTEPGGSTPGIVTATKTFTEAGVYMVSLTLIDSCGGIGSTDLVNDLTAMVVVYDPAAGFVTGHGWIQSPLGAYLGDSSLSGKASFGFVSRYQKGATIPTGQTEFRFRVADLSFHSTSYEWLVVAGSRAQFKGVGTVNGIGNFGFMLTAIDGDLSGGEPDRFRIKIWDKNNADTIVYDNQLAALDSAMPTTVLQAGNIIIEKQ